MGSHLLLCFIFLDVLRNVEFLQYQQTLRHGSNPLMTLTKCVGVVSVGNEPLIRSSCYFIGRNDQRFLSVFVFDYHLYAGIWERVSITHHKSFVEMQWIMNHNK